MVIIQSKRKKLLLLNYEFPPIGGGGGRSSYDVASRLVDTGLFEIDVVTMAFGDLPQYETVNQHFRIHRVKPRRNQIAACNPLEQALFLKSGYKKCVELLSEKKFDLCHCHFIIPTGLIAQKLKQRFGLNYIITAHGSDVLGHNPRYTMYYRIILSRWISILRQASAVTCASEYLKKQILKNLNLQKLDIIIIPNTIPEKTFSPIKKRKQILVVSRLARSKGIQDLIEALRHIKLAGWKVNIVGEGPYTTKLEKMIKNYGLNNQVKLLGWIDRNSPTMKKLYGEASIFICPSHFENMNLTILEAMQSGCAIIATDAGGNEEIVGHHGVMVKKSSPRDLAQSVEAILKSSNLLTSLQKASLARSKVLSRIDPTVLYKKLFRKLLSQKTASKSRPISICFISRSAYPVFDPECKATFGGAETETYLLATELAKDSRFKVKLIAGDFGQRATKIVENVEIMKSYRASDIRPVQIIKLFYQIVKSNSDWYYQASASGGSGLIAAYCQLKNRKFLYRTASEIECNGKYIKLHRLEGIFYKYGITHASYIAAQNEYNQQDLANTHNLSSILIKSPFKLPSKPSSNRKYILWVARSNKLKQPEIFLDIVKALPKHRFVMICPKANSESVDYTLLQNAARLSNLTFIPNVEFTKIDRFFSEAKLFINTSTYEGFPITFIQALMHGCPVCSLNVNPDQFITKHNCGIYAEGDVSRLIDDINEVLKNHSLYSQLSKNAFNYAKKNHDLDTVVEKFKKIFLYKQ